jgi:hypothetical protein
MLSLPADSAEPLPGPRLSGIRPATDADLRELRKWAVAAGDWAAVMSIDTLLDLRAAHRAGRDQGQQEAS